MMTLKDLIEALAVVLGSLFFAVFVWLVYQIMSAVGNF